ncbi:NAD(FAD)-dependent dehydrogenase [Caldisphaera lagunensis DSM 15908]|uniref:NAD(FAD)-dependent dehydrogenase n=1 Tax=Caldisphaera lagunensis (strain DSM 15908 / JCM 11604 / ANMR 0165 / IC-154) TaxID=1056495 RepID=L0AAW9_CALLD|nr:FAD-dependent oxidoreductase [Caldisphaera lagunensis]AFZ70272.1 NAD(FAD)-dependent dehydrogenase [Caldisphaera lagunensis DSM 15908]
MQKIVIIGAGAGGMAVASRAKRLNNSLNVTVLEKTNYASFALCGIPYYIGNIVKELDDLLFYPPEEFTKRGIDLKFGKEVTEVDVENKTLRFRDLKTGKEETISWDKLVLATGAKSKVSKIWPEINNAKNIFYITHLDSGEIIRNYALNLGKGKKAIIIGSGYVGLELIENLINLGLKVTVIEALNQILPRMLDPDLAGIVEDYLKTKGVEIIKNSPVESFEIQNNLAVKVKTSNGNFDGDMFVIGIGIEPNNDLAKQMKLNLGNSGGVIVNEKLLTNNPDVYAVGDVTEHKDLITGKYVWRPFAQIANKMGYIAGSNIGGMEAEFRGSVGTSALKAFDIIIARTGLSKAEAEKLGFKPIEASMNAGIRAHYIPGGENKIYLKIVADNKTGKLLGAQAIGPGESVFWRVNVIASLLTIKGTIWDLFNSDIGYQPTLSPAWDPLIIASRLLMRDLGEKPPSSL